MRDVISECGIMHTYVSILTKNFTVTLKGKTCVMKENQCTNHKI